MRALRTKRWVVAATVLLCLLVLVFENFLTSSGLTSSSGSPQASQKALAVLTNFIVPPKPITMELPHYPLCSEADLDPLLREIGDSRVVLLGEASHGTAEYYTWRAATLGWWRCLGIREAS